MIYIHKLEDLNIKSADIESVSIIRELKSLTPLPLTFEKLDNYLFKLYITDEERTKMQLALESISSVTDTFKEILENKDPLYELFNVQRSISTMSSLSVPLIGSINYSDEFTQNRLNFLNELIDVLNSLSKLKTHQEKINANDRMKNMFIKLLRNNEFFFNYSGIISGEQKESINSLYNSMKSGYLFHMSLEEELRKETFESIKRRIPDLELSKIDELTNKIGVIKEGINIAYTLNIRMINLAIIMYSYIKWINSNKL